MIIGLGNDIVSIERVQETLNRFGASLYAPSSAPRTATRAHAREARALTLPR